MNRFQKNPRLERIHHANEGQGKIPVFENGHMEMKGGTVGQVPTIQADGTTEFATPAASPTVASIKITTFTADGTWTKDAKCLFLEALAVGGGGGGGGVSGNPAVASVAAGGGGGGSASKWYMNADTSATETVTRGSGGTAGANTGGNGGTGGTTTFKGLSATGGTGGTGDGGTPDVVGLPGGTGGTGSGGDLNWDGGIGEAPTALTASGQGGTTNGGTIGQRRTGNAVGQAGTKGGGGSGAITNDATNRAGGAGGNGFVMVTEYLSA